MDVLSLGHAASKIADKFAGYQQYSVFKIDTDVENSETTKKVQSFKTPEEYEEKTEDLTDFISRMKNDEVLFICVGSSFLTGCVLRILESLKHKKVSILYVRPDLSLMGEKNVLQEKIVFGVLQQYVRSGLLDKIFLVDNIIVEEIIGDIPITQYYDKINDLIVTTYHMINVYKHIKPILETRGEISQISRIGTFGIVDQTTGKDKLFFPLEFVTNYSYFYSYPKKVLEIDGKIHQKIKKQIKDKISENIKVSFGIYETTYDKPYTYCEVSTHFVQGEKI